MKTNQCNNQVQSPRRPWHLLAAVLGFTAVLVACGGGGGSTGSVGSGGTGFSGPISGFGSEIVNGVRLDDSSAKVTVDDDDTSKSPSDLRLGMMVEIEGSRNDDGVTGKANTIGSHSVVQGPITTKTATTLTVLGLTVTVKPGTVFDGVTDLTALAVGDVVEIHGIANGADGLTATRIESTPGATEVRLTGEVTGLDTVKQQFTLHGTVVNYAGAAGNNLPTNLANGLTVRVRGTLATAPNVVPATINATRVRVRNLDNLKKDGKQLELEGIVTKFTSVTDFEVNGNKVSVAASAKVEGTVAAGSRVEVEGTVNATGVLVATKVEVKNDDVEAAEANELHGLISAFNLTAKSFTLRGVTVTFDTATVFERLTNGAASLANGVKVQVKGKVVGNTVLAARISLED